MPMTKLGMDEEIKRLIKTDKEFRRLYAELEANGGASHDGINEIYKKRFGRDWPGHQNTQAGAGGFGGQGDPYEEFRRRARENFRQTDEHARRAQEEFRRRDPFEEFRRQHRENMRRAQEDFRRAYERTNPGGYGQESEAAARRAGSGLLLGAGLTAAGLGGLYFMNRYRERQRMRQANAARAPRTDQAAAA